MIIGVLIIFLHKFCNRKLFNSSHTIKKCHFFSPPFWKHPFFSSECSRNVPATFPQKRLASCHGSTPARFSLLKGLEVLSGEWSISKADPLQGPTTHGLPGCKRERHMLSPCPHGWQWHQLHPKKLQVILTGVFYLRGLLPPCLSTSLGQMCYGL